MEETQLLTSALDESETHYFSAEDEDERNNCPKKIIGIIRIAENDKEYDIFQGDTISIGRDPENCNIVLENKSLSRVHAIIEVDKKDGEVLIYDNKAMNHTWKDNKKLKPLVRYELKGGEILKFGSVSAVFQIHSNTKENNKENSTFISNETDVTLAESNANKLIIPETPINIQKDANTVKVTPASSSECHSINKSYRNCYFIPETQSSPKAKINERNNLPSSNFDLTSLDHSTTKIEGTVAESLEVSLNRSLDKPGENTLDESSFINPTQSIRKKICTNNKTLEDKENIKSSKDRITTDESINRSSDFKSLDVIISKDKKNNQNVDVTSESNTYATFFEEKSLYSDTSTTKIDNDDTQKLSNENYSLLMAETQKLPPTNDKKCHKTPNASILLEETQKIIKPVKNNFNMQLLKENGNTSQNVGDSFDKRLQEVEDSDDEDFFQPTQLPSECQFGATYRGTCASQDEFSHSAAIKEQFKKNRIDSQATDVITSTHFNVKLDESSENLNTTCSTDINVSMQNEDQLDRSSPCTSENLLADLSSDGENDVENELNEKEELSDDEYVEMYEDATQLLNSKEDGKSLSPDGYCTTQLSNEVTDTILSSQESTYLLQNKTDLLTKTMSLTQKVCDTSKESLLETQYDIVDMTLASQTKSQNTTTKDVDSNVSDTIVTYDNLAIEASGKRMHDDRKTDSQPNEILVTHEIQEDSPDIDEDSLDYLASTQELTSGLISKEKLRENDYVEKGRDLFPVSEENDLSISNCSDIQNVSTTNSSPSVMKQNNLKSTDIKKANMKDFIEIPEEKVSNSETPNENNDKALEKLYTKETSPTTNQGSDSDKRIKNQSLDCSSSMTTIFSLTNTSNNLKEKGCRNMRKRTRDSSKSKAIAKTNEMRMNLRKRDSKKENKTEVGFDMKFSDKNSRSKRARVNCSDTNVKLTNVESASIENKNTASSNTRPTRACKKQTTKDQYCIEHLDKLPLKLQPSKTYSTRRNKKTNPPKLETVAETPPPRKRIKQGSSEKSEVTPSQSPSSRIRKKHIVMFTGYDDPQHQRYMKELGAEIATSAKNQPTVLVTDKVRRTEKFLCALGRGIPIVSKDWVTQSKSVNSILDPYAHIIEDKEVERKYGFNLRNSIDSASKNPLLLNYKIHATKSCLPSPKEIKEIVECAGGSSLKQMPRKGSSDIVIISCPEDKSDVKKAVKLGFNVQDKEFLLTGLLKQKLDFDSHVLSAV